MIGDLIGKILLLKISSRALKNCEIKMPVKMCYSTGVKCHSVSISQCFLHCLVNIQITPVLVLGSCCRLSCMVSCCLLIPLW
jgi:hypothetical protein